MRWIVVLLLALSACAAAADDVVYMGGTVSGLQPEITGRLDINDPNSLVFESKSGESKTGENNSSKTPIPFSAITSYEYTRELTHHLGVLPTIAVGLVRTRKHRHYVRINWREAEGPEQIALFEVPKQMPKSLLPILQARAPKACSLGGPQRCSAKPQKENQ